MRWRMSERFDISTTEITNALLDVDGAKLSEDRRNDWRFAIREAVDDEVGVLSLETFIVAMRGVSYGDTETIGDN